MTRHVGLAFGAVVFYWAAGDASGQFVFGPRPFGGYGYRANVAYSTASGRLTVGGVIFRQPAPWGPTWGGFGGPGFGWPGPVAVVPPPVIVVPPPLVGPPAGDRADDAPPPKGDFVVIRPRKEAGPVVRMEPPIPPPLPPAADARKADPREEAVRQMGLARAAFAADEYGRAAERLAEAVRVKPDDPLAYFLLAQVRFARGEYAEAVAAVRDGMRHAPNWPASGFRPRELYADRPGLFDDHLAELRRAYAANPDDLAVGFLLGYQSWFTGGRDEAVRLFRRVAARVRDNGVVERFLAEAEGKFAAR